MTHGINAKLDKKYFKCEMCHVSKVQEVYIWGNFPIPPEHPYKELKICPPCAKREHGTKNKQKLKDIIDRRTKLWLGKQQER